LSAPPDGPTYSGYEAVRGNQGEPFASKATLIAELGERKTR
jgi:hypothetical protein